MSLNIPPVRPNSKMTDRLDELKSQKGILSTVVGSYPVPHWMLTSRDQVSLRDAIMVTLKTQELAGIDVVSDGELSRYDPSHPETQGMIEYFVRPLDGVEGSVSLDDMKNFVSERRLAFRRKPAGIVTGRVSQGTLNLPEDCNIVRMLTDRPIKFTLTSPYMLANMLLNKYYANKEELAWDISQVLKHQVQEIKADVIQVDEAHLTGHPEDWRWAAKVINNVLDSVQGEKAVHLCFGNYRGQTIQSGKWEDLVGFLNELEADHVVLEAARRSPMSLRALKEVKSSLELGIGVIDIKDNEIETERLVSNRINQAVKILGKTRVKWVHPDCGLWMLHRSVADGKLRTLVKGLELYLD